MAYSVLWTPDAERDLDAIVSYYSEVLGAEAATESLLNGMESLAHGISTFPLAHERVRDGLLARRGYRKALVDDYVVLYLVDDARKEVVITNVVHGRRDYARLL